MELINYTEKWVFETLEELLAHRTDICRCEQCLFDMAAHALNRLNPNYVVSQHGSIYAKTKMLGQQHRADVLTEVTKAIERVSSNPHHLA